LSAEEEKIDFVPLRLFKLYSSCGLVLLLFVLFESVLVISGEARLFMDKLISGFIQLVNMIAEVLGGGELEKVRVEGWHVGLDVVEEVGLH
jgi:hypothetical protein